MTLHDVILRAAARELTLMHDESTGRLPGDSWTGEALATWIAPVIVRALRRAITQGKLSEKELKGRSQR